MCNHWWSIYCRKIIIVIQKKNVYFDIEQNLLLEYCPFYVQKHFIASIINKYWSQTEQRDDQLKIAYYSLLGFFLTSLTLGLNLTFYTVLKQYLVNRSIQKLLLNQ